MAGRPILKAKLAFHLDITRRTGAKKRAGSQPNGSMTLDIGRIERCGGIAACFEDARGEGLLALLQFEHALLDPALRDKLVG